MKCQHYTLADMMLRFAPRACKKRTPERKTKESCRQGTNMFKEFLIGAIDHLHQLTFVLVQGNMHPLFSLRDLHLVLQKVIFAVFPGGCQGQEAASVWQLQAFFLCGCKDEVDSPVLALKLSILFAKTFPWSEQHICHH